VYCNDADGLFGAFGPVHNPDDWQLFIDSSKISLKAVLLHNGNIYPPVPLAYSFHMKKSHESSILSSIALTMMNISGRYVEI
jgi:hypothetical protein